MTDRQIEQNSVNRVIIVANYAAFYSGNFIASLTSLEERLKKYNVAVSFIFPKGAPFANWGEDGKFLEHHEVHISDFNRQALTADLKKLVKDRNTSVHFHFLDWKTLWMMKNALKDKHPHMIFQEHMRVNFLEEQNNRGIPGRLKAHLKKLLYKYATSGYKVIGVSDAVYDDLCAIREVNDTYMVRNAILTERLDGDWDNTLKMDPIRDVVIFGTHFDRKGVDIALKAVRMVGNGIRLIVLSHHEEDAIKRLDAVDFEWRKFAVVKHVVENVPCAYNHALCFISPSRSEAFGYAVVEAAYCNTQVIASDVPGQNSMKCIPGIQWVGAEKIDELAKALNNCYEMKMNKPEELRQQKEIQRDYIRKHFGLNKWCDEIISLYGLK